MRILAFTLLMSCLLTGPAGLAEEEFGPPNLLKSTATPFGGEKSENTGSAEDSLQISAGGRLSSALGSRLISGTRVYLPGRMVLGKSAEFVIKGRPGSSVAVAMADKNSGAKDIYGRQLRLGPDRKLVTLGTIPEAGVLSLFVETPIQGDLIGQHLYFETAVWTRPDFSDLEIAVPVKSEIGDTGPDNVNGVIVTADAEQKRGLRIVPNATIPLHMRDKSLGLDAARP